MADCGDDCRAAAIQLAAVILFMAEPIYLLWHYGFTGGPAHQTGSQILYRTSLSKFDKEMMNHACESAVMKKAADRLTGGLVFRANTKLQ